MTISTIAHIHHPRALLRNVSEVLKPGGLLVLSTPYHGYVKNLVIALTGRHDSHYDPLAPWGGVRFFSVKTISAILEETGFQDLEITRAGRAPLLWKAMVVRATRP